MIPIRVLVVEDSRTMRERIVEVLACDPGFVVVGEAEDGRRAIELCRELKPSVVTMDMVLPGLSGLSATEYIMAYCPTPILVVSSSLNRGELFRTYDALAAGAVDAFEKPDGSSPDGPWEEGFRAAVRMAAKIRVITHPRARLRPAAAPAAPPGAQGQGGGREPVRLAALGASTGGPGAVAGVLRGLCGFPPPVLIVIHIGRPFGGALAEWLDRDSPLRVACAEDGTRIPPSGSGRAFLAPPESHLVVRGGRLRLLDGPERNGCRPSVDALFESLAEEAGERAAACLLTGMGRDGAEGLLAVRRAGGATIAQDEGSCVVYGMPREAALLGAAERILPLEEIAPELLRLAKQK